MRRHASATHYGLTETELRVLSTYNAEVARGILHTHAWREQMACLQREFDDHSQNQRKD